MIGLPGSGKTTVGRLAAPLLGATFVDVDEQIEREERRTVSELFAERGEAAFRALEQARMNELLLTPARVIAPGGGWSAQPGSLESLRDRAMAVYLVTSPEVALRRVGVQGGRPLLEGADPLARMQELFVGRRVFYQRADAAVTTDGGTPEEVAGVVVALARSLGGW